MLKINNLHAKFVKSRETAKNVRILRAEMALLRTKKELRKNKKDEEEGKTFVFVVLFFGLERRRCRPKPGVQKLQKKRYSRLASAAMELYNASSQGLVYRVSKQGRTSLDHPARKESSTGTSEHGNF